PISTIFLLAAFLMSFISLSIGLFLFTIAIIADMVMVVVSTQSLAKSSDSFVFWISSICGIAAVVFLTTTIFTKVFMLSAIGNITVSMKGETSQFKNVLNMLPAELTNLETFIQYIANKIL
ncbi:MAG: hypothetical protein RR064_04730, partial [Oscillospiraceae bacterium]